jgi:aldehyde:ferredoxin oxidoreductase
VRIAEEKRQTYFETLGRDERGIPKKEILERLGLSDVEPKIEDLRE